MEKIKKILSNNLNLLLLFDIILLFVAVIIYFQEIDISYSFYTFLKWIISFTFCFFVYDLFKNNSNSKLILLYIIMFIFFNPFKPIELDEEVWVGIDLFTVILFISCFCFINKIPIFKFLRDCSFKLIKVIVNLIKKIPFFIVFVFGKLPIALIEDLSKNKMNIFKGFLLVLIQVVIWGFCFVLYIKSFSIGFLSDILIYVFGFLWVSFVSFYKHIFNESQRHEMCLFLKFLLFIIVIFISLYIAYNSLKSYIEWVT